MARPRQAIVLTGLPRRWFEVQGRMSKFVSAIRRREIDGSLAYHVEPQHDREATTTHCHAWWRGEHLSTARLRELAGAARMGDQVLEKSVTLQTRNYDVPTLDYGLKMILRDRPDHITGWWPSAIEYLELNGDRLVHSTHGFWQDWSGRRLSLRSAQQLARNNGRYQATRYLAPT